jgi:Type I restriction enzyme R protein N terminus (HSDR_N)
MVQTLQASKVTLGNLVEQFGLARTFDPQFFQEWQATSATVPSTDMQRLEQVQISFNYLLEKTPLLEDVVKLVVLAPLLELAGFYQPPFQIQSETEVEISNPDPENGVIVRGKIDVLVISKRLWMLVIESKMSDFSLTKAFPQALSYMLASSQRTCFGMITNGSEFVFLKLSCEKTPTYSISKLFSLLTPGNELVDVLRVLKHLGQLVVEER